MTADTKDLVREIVLTRRLNIPRNTIRQWRGEGLLTTPEHFVNIAGGIFITPGGVAKVAELLNIPPEVAVEEPALNPPEPTRVIAQIAGVNPRIIRCRYADGEPRDGLLVCSVKLTAPNVFAKKFRRGDILDVLPTETPGVFEYDGTAPRRHVI